MTARKIRRKRGLGGTEEAHLAKAKSYGNDANLDARSAWEMADARQCSTSLSYLVQGFESLGKAKAESFNTPMASPPRSFIKTVEGNLKNAERRYRDRCLRKR